MSAEHTVAGRFGLVGGLLNINAGQPSCNRPTVGRVFVSAVEVVQNSVVRERHR